MKNGKKGNVEAGKHGRAGEQIGKGRKKKKIN